MNAMIEALRHFLKDLGSLKGKTLFAAVSGGADSVCLLLALDQLRPEFGYQLRALHCNHGLRGRSSDADERFVRKLCQKLRIRLRTYRTRLGKGSGTEERGREFRRRCFRQACQAARARYVFLAHHAGDQAETLLMNLARGAGLSGAAAMRPVAPLEGAPKGRLCRPWLEMDPKGFRAELKRRGQTWREDLSNADTALKRNALRRKVLPQLEKLLPGAVVRMAAFSRRAAEVAVTLERVVARDLDAARLGGQKGWDLALLKAKEPGLRRFLLKALGGKAMDEAAVSRAEALLLKGHGRADLRGKTHLTASRNRLILRKG
jgi:tRNA(Ile)-lysidine synthetase-like protein